MRMYIREIQLQVARHFAINVRHMTTRGRRVVVAWPRQIAMYLARELTEASYPVIGRLFGRDHTTVMHAIRHVTARQANDPLLAAEINRLRATCAAQCERLRQSAQGEYAASVLDGEPDRLEHHQGLPRLMGSA